ncbi:type IV secretion protein Rhs [Klebsiella aerogenes]
MRYFYLLFILVLCGCSPLDVNSAQEEVSRFHDFYQSGKYIELYNGASKTLQESISESDFVNVLKRAEVTDLGKFQKTTLKSQKKVKHLIGSDEVVLIYASVYSKRIVQEIFVFEKIKGNMKLKGYKYDSIN